MLGLLHVKENEYGRVVLTLLKPAVLEERNGEIEYRVVNNDGSRESMIVLTGLKCLFQKQLPKMPKDYIARLVYDRTHLSIAIVKNTSRSHWWDNISTILSSQVCRNRFLRCLG